MVRSHKPANNRCVLITRPLQAALRSAVLFENEGFSTLISPMMDIVALNFEIENISQYQGVIATSAHAFCFDCDAVDFKIQTIMNKPLYVVGGRTADAARDIGFCNVTSADGDAMDLIALTERNIKNVSQPFLYLSGEDVSRDIDRIGQCDVDRVVTYKAQTCLAFDNDVANTLKNDEIDCVVFYSKRTAEIFIKLIQNSELAPCLRTIKALCISKSVVKCVQPELWGGVYVSPLPNEVSMLKMLNEI